MLRIPAALLGLSFVAALAVGASSATAEDPPSSLTAAQQAAIDAIGAASIAGRGTPGVTIAIERNGSVVYAKGFGLRDVEDGVADAVDTRFPIGSNTKQFTAAAILLLQDAGKLNVDDKLSTYAPDIPHAKEVTIRELLTHAGGYAEITAQPNFDEISNRPATTLRVVSTVDAKPLDFKPGTKREYSNTGYELLDLVIERVSGEPFGQFLAQHIFTPLGMTNTYVRDYDDTSPNVATEYSSFALGPWEHAQHIDYSWFGGAGSIISSPADLFKWNAALDGGKLLSAKSLHEMMTPMKIGSGGAYDDYGFGIEVTKLPNGHRAILHGGNTTGAATQDARFPDDGLSIVVLADSGTYDYTSAVSAIYSVLVPSPAPAAAASAAAGATPAAKAPPAAAAKPIPGSDPATTKRAERWLDDAIAGNIDFSQLRTDFRERLTPEHVAAIRALAPLGKRTYTLVTVERRPPLRGYLFLVDTPQAHLIYAYLLQDDGKLAAVQIIEHTIFPTPAPAQ